MKVILSGATGYIGGEVLTHCLNHPSISTLLILSRRPIPSVSTNPKAKVIILEDFTTYPPAAQAELTSASAAIWCLGTSTGDVKVDIEYPLAFLHAIKSRTEPTDQPFRHVQLSGAFTEPPPGPGTEERPLWFFARGRRVRGRMETEVLKEDSTAIAVYLLKPGGVASKERAWLTTWVFGDSLSVRIDELAATLVDVAVHGGEKRLWTNPEIVRRGRELLQAST